MMDENSEIIENSSQFRIGVEVLYGRIVLLSQPKKIVQSPTICIKGENIKEGRKTGKKIIAK